MQVVAGLCMVLFIVTVTAVGVRMLALARRTRGRPELLMGAGMVLIGALGYPGSIASGYGRAVADVSLPIWLGSSVLTQIGILLIYAFTWQVFRPREGWARGLVGVGAGFLLASLAGGAAVLAQAAPEANSAEATRGWMLLGLVGYSGCFFWAAVEGFAQYRSALRRLALGLADPVVANRFFLFGAFGALAAGVNVASAIGTVLALDPASSLAILVPMGVLGFLASVVVYLAFLPPRWYVSRVRVRA